MKKAIKFNLLLALPMFLICIPFWVLGWAYNSIQGAFLDGYDYAGRMADRYFEDRSR